jgi:hypothetical protein
MADIYNIKPLFVARVILSAVVAAPFMFFILVSARFLPKFLIWFLQRSIRKYEKKAQQKGIEEPLGMKLLLAFYQQSAWIEVMPLLDRSPKMKDKTFYANVFACLYWRNERFDETISALKYWNSTALDWMREHPEEAKQARRMLQRIHSWRLRPFQENEYGKLVTQEKYFKTRKKLTDLTSGFVEEWRRSCVALELLKWSAKYNYEPAQKYAAHLQQNRKFYFFVLLTVDYELAEIVGLSVDEFDALCKNCERWD